MSNLAADFVCGGREHGGPGATVYVGKCVGLALTALVRRDRAADFVCSDGEHVAEASR
jgi:hypothetical protein